MSEITDTPQGFIHIDQRTGQPARFIGAPHHPGAVLAESVFSDPSKWEPTTWEQMSPAERKAYKHQYPVV